MPSLQDLINGLKGNIESPTAKSSSDMLRTRATGGTINPIDLAAQGMQNPEVQEIRKWLNESLMQLMQSQP